jgi:hypothetical protein
MSDAVTVPVRIEATMRRISDLRPDESHVDAPGDHWLQRRIVGRLAEAGESPVLQAGNAGRELEAKQGAQSKDMIGIAAASVW